MPAAGQKKGDDGMFYYPELTKSPGTSPSKRRKRSDTPPPRAAADVDEVLAVLDGFGSEAAARRGGRETQML